MATESAPQVPFWLQLFLVALAPIVGLVGVLFGAYITQRNERLKWVRDERLRAYSEFVSSAIALHRVGIDVAVQMRSAGRETGMKARQAYEKKMGDLLELLVKVELISSDGFRKSARIVADQLLDTGTLLTESLKDGIDDEKQNAIDALAKSRLEEVEALRELVKKDLSIEN